MVDFGIFAFNFGPIIDFFLRSPIVVLKDILFLFAWVFLANYFIKEGWHLFLHHKQHEFAATFKWVLLAIDIPAINVQTPKAVEQMFSHLAGAFSSPNFKQKYWQGYVQKTFSFEIISIQGYIQFLVRTDESLRDLVEAAIYAQYPEADIIEVEDYVSSIPDKYPDQAYDVWAADFTLTEHFSYPIRSYHEFEHSISKDTVLKDSMGTFLESFSRLGPGEQMWYQIVVEPTSNVWKEECIEKVKELKGEEVHHHGEGVFALIGGSAATWSKEFVDHVVGRESEVEHEEEKKGDLAPGAGKLIEGIETKIQKLGLKTMMRGVYVARKEVFGPQRGVNALVGALNQFNIPSANCIAPTYSSKKDKDKMKLMKAYKTRSIASKNPSYVLNIEELATLWHFPMSHVKTPLVQKAQGKRAEPPSGLPVETIQTISLPVEPEVQNIEEKKYRTDAGDISDVGGVKFG